MDIADEADTVSGGKRVNIITVKADVLRHINLLSDVDIIIKHKKPYK